MTSIRELADKLGVTKTAIFQHIDRLGDTMTDHTKKVNNRRVIDDKGVKLIVRSFQKSRQKPTVQTPYRLLANERKAEIISKDNEIKRLNKLLTHSQELQLRLTNSSTNAPAKQKVSNDKRYSVKDLKNKGFWWKLSHLF